MLKRTRALASVAVIAVMTGLGAPAWAETLKDALGSRRTTVIMIGLQRAPDVVMCQQLAAVAGVFGRNNIDLRQHRQRTGADVGKITDRGGDNVERGFHLRNGSLSIMRECRTRRPALKPRIAWGNVCAATCEPLPPQFCC